MTGFAAGRRGHPDLDKIEVKSEPFEKGYHLYARLPYDAFGVERPGTGLPVGFDIGMVSHDEAGSRAMLAVWSGNKHIFHHPRPGYLFLNP